MSITPFADTSPEARRIDLARIINVDPAAEREARAVATELEKLDRRASAQVAARARPKVERDNDRWRAVDANTGITGTGWTAEQAIENWEANFREATTAQQ